MKKKRIIIGIIGLFVIGIFFINHNVYAVEDTKLNKDSYWSVHNAPIFYGATKIVIPKGMLDTFDVNDTRFRLFAKDFEDGDLSHKIAYQGSVDVNHVGTYPISYHVKDSHGNVSKLTVPVEIVDSDVDKIKVERTLYTIPSVWNLDMIGIARCNYGDRQLLGIYMPEGSSIRARIKDADSNISLQFINNDSKTETSYTLKPEEGWVTISNTKEESSYDAVPLFTSSVMKKEEKDITKTYTVELEYDTSVKELNYYHYKDDEESFRKKWKEEENSYGVIENEVLTVVVPFYDLDMTTNYHAKGFTSLDQFLEYYQKVVDKMDEYIGLSLNPSNILDQNVRTKYLVRANIHGAGAAYYATNHVGINSSHVHSFFEMNWGGLHELAHGYQGSLGKGEMQLGEVANNILGYYIQEDKSIYFHPGSWLGDLPSTEEKYNKERLLGSNFLSVDVGTRLYAIINLLNSFERGTSYGKIFQWYRREIASGRSMSNQDAYVEAMADIYHVNIIPYMDAWGLPIEDDIKEKVYDKNYPMVGMLNEMVDEDNLSSVMESTTDNRKYGVVENDLLSDFHLTGNIKLHIDIDDIKRLTNKKIRIKSGKEVIKEISITEKDMVIENLPIGTYKVEMPVDLSYLQDYFYITVKDKETKEYTYTYQKIENLNYDNYLTLKLQGIYGTYGYEIKFSNNYKKATITLGGANMGGDAYVIVSDQKGNIISEERNKENHFEHTKAPYEISLQPGFVIEVYHNNYNRIKVFSTLTGKEIEDYKAKENTTKYIVTENGLKTLDMTEDEVADINYQMLKEYLEDMISNYQKEASEEEIKDSNVNFRKKAFILQAYSFLKEEDQKQFQDFIKRIEASNPSPIVEEENYSSLVKENPLYKKETVKEEEPIEKSEEIEQPKEKKEEQEEKKEEIVEEKPKQEEVKVEDEKKETEQKEEIKQEKTKQDEEAPKEEAKAPKKKKKTKEEEIEEKNIIKTSIATGFLLFASGYTLMKKRKEEDQI